MLCKHTPLGSSCYAPPAPLLLPPEGGSPLCQGARQWGHGLALSLASTRVEKKEGDPLMAWHWCATIPRSVCFVAWRATYVQHSPKGDVALHGLCLNSYAKKKMKIPKKVLLILSLLLQFYLLSKNIKLTC